MESFNTIKSFVLGIEHSYEDPAYVRPMSLQTTRLTVSHSVGDPPYDIITNFGKVQLNEELAPCTVDGDTTTCKQTDAVIKAPIYATIAKR
jgi:hypothetical protein